MDVRKLKRWTAAPIVARKAQGELRRFLAERLPRLGEETSPDKWKERAAGLRTRFLELLFRGHAPGLLQATFPVEWREEREPGAGYRIRKLVYEGYPGLWVPALLYEPAAAGEGGIPAAPAGPAFSIRGAPAAAGGPDSGKIPAVLNACGHHPGGIAASYNQARCINLAKRGMLALSFELLGMGELLASRPHTRLSQLDLLGVEGAGVFYLVMKRALDVLLGHPRADAGRAAMTGFSGGGWQTVLLSALDERVTAAVPVAGHTPVWQRISHPSDVGDSEQLPVDFCTVGDYDTLSAMLAPRPTLFIYNHRDTCCFPTSRARESIVEPARRYFSLLEAADKVEMYDNRDPGTHNYERRSRERLYSFLNTAFGLSTDETELPWENELCGEEALRAGIPPDNATPLSLALEKWRTIAASSMRAAPDGEARRAELRRVLRLPAFSEVKARAVRSTVIGGIAVRQLEATVCGWSVPMIHARLRASSRRRSGARPKAPSGRGQAAASQAVAPNTEAAAAFPPEGPARSFFKGGELVLAVEDTGRQKGLERAIIRCPGSGTKAAGLHGPVPAHILAMDIFATGELRHWWKAHMLVGAAGERSLGIQAAMIVSAARWMIRTMAGGKVSLQAGGMTSTVAALAAAALEPSLFSELWTEGLPASLSCLIEWPVDYEAAPSLFCFGLLERFDIPDLVRLCAPVRVAEIYRGPLP